MPDVDVRIFCGVHGATPDLFERTITVSQDNLDLFFPPSSNGWGYWPRRKEAESLICSILKEERFQDEVTPVENEADLRRIGVTYLKVAFDSEDVGHNMGSTLIEQN